MRLDLWTFCLQTSHTLFGVFCRDSERCRCGLLLSMRSETETEPFWPQSYPGRDSSTCTEPGRRSVIAAR